MEALNQRRTDREFKPGTSLSAQELSNLLWAAFGINRPETGQRTAPSAMNSQEIDLYVALPAGLYLYEAKPNQLAPVVAGDLRNKTSGQPYIKDAAVVLIYVADLTRFGTTKPDTRSFYASFDAGCICQNVYLFCASAGLATVVYELNRPPLAKAMNLRPDQQIISAQAVGSNVK
jgi:nitroreductase